LCFVLDTCIFYVILVFDLLKASLFVKFTVFSCTQQLCLFKHSFSICNLISVYTVIIL